MSRKSLIQMRIEEEEADGYKLYKQGSGIISTSERSKLGACLTACESDNHAADVIYVTGAKKRYASEGHDWAVMYKTA